VSSSGLPSSPKLLRGALVQFSAPMLVPIPNIIIFQYNPESLSRTIEPYQLPESKAAGADKAVPDAAGTTQPKPPTEKFTLALQLDASDALEVPDLHPVAVVSGVADRLAALEMLLYADDPLSLGTLSLAIPATLSGAMSAATGGSVAAQAEKVPKGKTPTVLFIWGPGRIVPVRLTTFTVDEQLNNPLLYPLRAKVSLGLQVLTRADFSKDDPDTAEKLAIACYKFTMAQKRVLALANVANDVESIRGLLPF
jgi:hypothetical protein